MGIKRDLRFSLFSSKYVNKQDVLLAKMASKVVNYFSMSFKILFEVRGGGSPFSKLTYVIRGFFNLK